MKHILVVLFLTVSGSAFAQLPDSGLVCQYPFSGNARDASIFGNHGLVHGAVLVADRFGAPNSAYYFNGNGAFIEVPHSSSLEITTGLTVSAWVRTDPNKPQYGNAVITKGNDFPTGPPSAGDWNIMIYDEPNAGMRARPHARIGGELRYYDGITVLQPGVWYHLIMTYDGTYLRSYVNGVPDGSALMPGTLPVTQSTLRIGVYDVNGAPGWFAGDIDDIAVFNRALSAQEIAGLNGTATLKIAIANREGRGMYPAPLVCRLTDLARGTSMEVLAQPDSSAVFHNLVASDGYAYGVYQTASGPWRNLLLGKGGPIEIVDQETKQISFEPSTPFITSVTVAIDSSGEVLPPDARHLVAPGTRIRVTAEVKNPSAVESTAVQITAVLDRDTTGSSDISAVSATDTIPPGATELMSVVVSATRVGDYFASVGVRSSSSTYASTLTDGWAWIAPVIRLTPASGAAPWEPVNTGISHMVIIPASAAITVNGQSIEAGDYLGVFHDSAGVLVCAGMERWTGQENLALAAFGDDPTTSAKDGFASGETIRWRVFRTQADTVSRLRAYYEAPSGIVTNTGAFAVNGISRITSLAGPESEQCLTLRQGWSLISLNVQPPSALVDSMFKSVSADLVLLKNSQQKVFIPSVPVNSIGQWQPVEGYQVKFSAARTLCFIGAQLDPAQYVVPLQQGWSYIPYLRDTEMPVSLALSGMTADVVLMKDQDGRAYVPGVGLNAIGTMKPGQAYQIKMKSARDLTYPASVDAGEQADLRLSGSVAKAAVAPWTFTNTGTSHTVIIPVNAVSPAYGLTLAAGDLIGFFYDSLGTDVCAGYETWTGSGAIGVAVFGDDATTPAKDGYAVGEALRIKVWFAQQNKAYVPIVTYLAVGGLSGLVTDTTKFVPNGISALSVLGSNGTGVGETSRPTSFALDQNYPNPFNPSTVIPYALGSGGHVRLSVISPLGQEMRVLVDEYQDAGEYRSTFDAAGLASGMYFYRLTAGQFTQTRKLLLVR